MNVEFQLNKLQPGSYIFQKYDKQRDLPFTYTQYIKFRSKRAVHQTYNITVSRLVSILYIFNSDEVAIEEIQILINTMSNNGFYKPHLLNIINKFLLRNQVPGIKVNIQKNLSSLMT
jgi:hypothetical protein